MPWNQIKPKLIMKKTKQETMGKIELSNQEKSEHK